MAHMLDTSVIVSIRDGDLAIRQKANALPGPIIMSIVTRVELESGVYRDATQVSRRRARLDEMLTGIHAMPFDEADAAAYGQIIAHSGYSRCKLLDRMIAAQAIVHRATLVTLNPSDFSDVPGLSLLGW